MSDNGRVTNSPITLAPWARRSSGTVGVALAGLGTWSVFLNTNQAGSAALLLLGALFILMAMTGRVPDRISKEGIEHDSVVGRAFEDLLANPEVKKEAAEALIHASEESASPATPSPAAEEPVGSRGRRLQSMARYVKLEGNVVDAIRQEFPVEEDERTWRELDCVVLRDDGPPVGVEVKAVSHPGNLRQVINRLEAHVSSGKIAAGVIVNAGPAFDSRRPLPEKVTVVSIDDNGVGEVSEADAERIRAAIRSTLEKV